MKHSRARSPEAIEFARDQRATANEFVQSVWQWGQSRQVCHQNSFWKSTDHFIEGGQERDRVRDETLASQGYLVVRISGFDVVREPERVCQGIEKRVRERMREMGVG